MFQWIWSDYKTRRLSLIVSLSQQLLCWNESWCLPLKLLSFTHASLGMSRANSQSQQYWNTVAIDVYLMTELKVTLLQLSCKTRQKLEAVFTYMPVPFWVRINPIYRSSIMMETMRNLLINNLMSILWQLCNFDYFNVWFQVDANLTYTGYD